MDEQRLIDIEMKISHQEFLIEKLQDVIYQQQTSIDQLEKKVLRLTKTLEESGVGKQVGPGNEKPPHY